MALGDVVAGLTAVASGNTLDIQPPAGQEWIIHNIYYDQSVDFYIATSGNSMKFDTDATAGARLGAVFHCTNTQWVRISNTSGVANNIAYDGMQTK